MAIIKPVTVVPMLAPMITPTACAKVINPAFTKPTTMTVVAEELWMTAVTANPIKAPMYLLVVSRSIIVLSREPAANSNPSPINFMPYRKSPSPQSSIMKFSIVISATCQSLKFSY